MRYSIEPRDRRYVKGYGFLSIAKYIGKSTSNKYSQKLVDSAKKSCIRCNKTASKRTIKKTAEGTGYLIGNKIIDEMTSTSKNLRKSCTQKNCHQMKLLMNHQKKDIYLHKKDNRLLMK